jgi:NADPH-dependent 2,4-dienoyl-CoA reductase/sulfur reductase-like enzyme
MLLAETPEGAMQIRWRKLVVATGAREFFLPFPGWTLPGVFGPGGLQAMMKNGWPVAGKRIVVAGSGPLLPAVADGLKQHGGKIQFIAEQASFSSLMGFAIALLAYPNKLVQGMGVKSRLLGVPYRFGWQPVKAEGDGRVERVTLTNGPQTRTLECDALACSFNLIPNTELAQLMGCALARGAVQVDALQMTSVPDVYCAGESAGVGGVDCALVEGQIAGLAAAGLSGKAQNLFAARSRWHRFRDILNKSFALRPELRAMAQADTLVCRCEDATRGSLESRAGWRDAKLHTRCGMGPCQGRVCGGAATFLFGWEQDGVRPPLFPASLSSLAADLSEIPPATTPKP